MTYTTSTFDRWASTKGAKGLPRARSRSRGTPSHEYDLVRTLVLKPVTPIRLKQKNKGYIKATPLVINIRTTIAVVPDRKKKADKDLNNANTLNTHPSKEKTLYPPTGGNDDPLQLHVSFVLIFRTTPSLRNVAINMFIIIVSRSPTTAPTTNPSPGPLVTHISSNVTLMRFTSCRARKSESK
jgi:hypothetical protein